MKKYILLATIFITTVGYAETNIEVQGFWARDRLTLDLTARTSSDMLCTVANWADSAASNYRWTFCGNWNSKTNSMTYKDAWKVHRTSNDNWQNAKEKLEYMNGTGKIYLKNNKLYWIADKEHNCLHSEEDYSNCQMQRY